MRSSEGTAALLLLALSAALAWIWVPGQKAAGDSVYYIEGARHLAAGDGYVTGRLDPGDPARWRPIARFPPGFSLLQVPGIRLGLSPPESAAWVLALSAVALALASFGLLRSAGAGPWSVALPGAWLAVANRGALSSLDAVLSDLPFAALASAAVLALVRIERRRAPDPRLYVLLGLLLGAASLVRWAGLYLLAGVLGAVVLSGRAESRLRAGLARAVLVAGGAGLLIGPWLVRNLLLAGSLAGPQRVETQNGFKLAGAALRGLAKLMFPYEAAFAGTPWLGALGYPSFAVAALLFVALLVVGRPAKLRVARSLLVVAAGYWLLMVASAALGLLYPATSARFWLILPGLLIAASAAIVEQGSLPAAWRGRARIALVAILVLAVFPQVTLTATGLERADRRRGWLSDSLRDSAPIRFVRALDAGCRVLANEQRLVLVYYERAPVYRLPSELDEARRALQGAEPVCLVLITREHASRPDPKLASQRSVASALEREGRIRLAVRDDWGSVFVSATSAD
jgi:hypothetical protein